MSDDKTVEGSQDEPTTEEAGKGIIPLTKYIGVKEAWGREKKEHSETKQALQLSLTQLTAKEAEVKNLAENLEQAKKSVVDPEKIKVLESERDKAKAETAQMKRDAILKEYKINPKDVEGLSDEQIQIFIKGKGQAGKPGADLGGGGGGGGAETARTKIKSGFESLHPTGR